jgi:hypothetical protein
MFGFGKKKEKADIDDATGKVIETPEDMKRCLEELREMMRLNEKETGFKYVRDDDRFLLAFLRAKVCTTSLHSRGVIYLQNLFFLKGVPFS